MKINIKKSSKRDSKKIALSQIAIRHTLRLRKEKNQNLALSQIFLLLISIFAFSYAFGSGVHFVSGITLQPGEGPTQALQRNGIPSEQWTNYDIIVGGKTYPVCNSVIGGICSTSYNANNIPTGTEFFSTQSTNTGAIQDPTGEIGEIGTETTVTNAAPAANPGAKALFVPESPLSLPPNQQNAIDFKIAELEDQGFTDVRHIGSNKNAEVCGWFSCEAGVETEIITAKGPGGQTIFNEYELTEAGISADTGEISYGTELRNTATPTLTNAQATQLDRITPATSTKVKSVGGAGGGGTTSYTLGGLPGKYADVTLTNGQTVSGIVTPVDGGFRIMSNSGKECLAGCTTPLTEAAVSNVQPAFNWGTFGGAVVDNLGYSLVIYGAIQLFGPILGLDSEETNALSEGAALGFFIGSTINSAAIDPAAWQWVQAIGPYATGIGIGIAVVYILHTYREEDVRIIQFSCVPWQAPTSGKNCEECNVKGLPCSEYQCKALGQGCEIVNKGTTEESCVWVNRNDVNPPIMEPWEDALLNDYDYTPDNTISPPDRGVIVEYEKSNDNCAPAFTPLQFGVLLDEPAKCKMDNLRKPSFEDMDLFVSEGLLRYNHTFSLSLPGSSNLEGEGIVVQNDGNYEVYVRCEDANGNFNIGNFVFNYCIDKGPDTTPPLIVQTSIPNEMPIAFNQNSVDVEFYINEPAECKWSHNDRDYGNMEESMTCATVIGQANGQGLYTCGTTLTGLKNKFDNEFFIRCKDQPVGVEESSRNVNSQSYRYVLKGTQALFIDSISPSNETIKDATDVVKVTFEVKTSAGFKEGEAACFYSDTGLDDDFIEFFNTNSHEHSQDLFLPEGSYTYHIKCSDLGGNTDSKTISFDVESDNSAPIVVRAYHEETFLKLTTIEEARCVYDVIDCSYNFDDGVKITSANDLNHFVDWNIESNLYVKCRDGFGNEPLPNQCSIIAKTTDF